MVIGRITTKENEVAKILADEIIPLAKARERFAGNLLLEVDESCVDEELMKEIEDIFQKNPGSVNVLFRVNVDSGKSFTVRSNRFRVAPETELLHDLQHLLGERNVKIIS